MKTSPLQRVAGLLAAALVVAFASVARAQPDAHATLPNIDRRHIPTLPATASPAAAAALARNESATALRAKVRNVRIDFDALLGTPGFVGSANGHLTGPGGSGGAVSDQALNRFAASDSHRVVKAFVDEYQALFGHGSDVVAAARVARDYVTGRNGLRSIRWEQQLDQIRVFEATLQAHLTSRGELVNVASRLLPNVERAADRGAPDRAARLANPAISPAAAIALAATDIGEELAADDVFAAAAPEGAEKKQRFRAATLLDAEAQYVWLPLNADTLRLCWEIICTGKSSSRMYRVLVDAESGEVHVRQSLTEDASNVSYRVFTSDSPSPFSPGHATPSSVQPPLVSRALVSLTAANLVASPNGWIDDGVMETRGNNIDAHTDIDANNVADTPRPQATLVGGERVFDPPLDLSQAPSTYRDAAVVNLFYWCNWMHDKLYELGFDEAAGNFQVNNFGRGGLGNDPVQADAQDGSGTDNANFSTPPDGSSGRLQMFLWTGPVPDRDGDFDHEIVLHEYTHGLTNRLVGGGVGISALQPRGMGEGWSDFYPIAMLAEATDDINGNWARAGYSRYLASGTFTENYYYGGRRYPYSTNLTKNPLTFKDIDPAQASAHAGIPRSPIVGTQADEVHNMGEVWCVTLWDVRANLIGKYGFNAGTQLTLELVTDALKLSPANPNFLQARDAILQADLVDTGGANRGELWAAFAKRGMGAGASSPASSATAGLVESFALPDDLAVTPAGTVAVAGNVGGPFAGQTYTLSNTGSTTFAWNATNTQPWASLSPSSGTLSPGGTANLLVSFTAAATSLAGGTYNDTLTFTNATTGISQTRTLTLVVQPPPTISSFTPTAIAPGLAVTITGTAFIAPLTVSFGGVNATSVTINSSTQITAAAPTTLIAGPISVTTAAGTATSATSYTVTTQPIISNFTPTSGPNKRMVTLNGANFSGGIVTSRTVRVNNVGVASLTVGANQLTFPVPVTATTGFITVTTNSTAGQIGVATSAIPFTVVAGSPPANNDFANAQVISGSSGTVDVNNTNATLEAGEPKHGGAAGGASVWYSWVAPSTGTYTFQVQDVGLNMGVVQGVYVGNAVNALALVASGSTNSPFSRFASEVMFTATAGTTYKIAVDGFEGLMGECRLAWAALGVPTISTITGSAYAGQSVSITGTNFAPGATVTIGGVPVSSALLTYNSATSITVTQVPSNVVTGKIAVTTVAGTAVSAATFTLLAAPAPSITGVSPTLGAPGATVTINGTALSLAEPGFPIVKFNNVAVTSISTQSSTSLSVRVPNGATTGTVTVETSKGVATGASFTVTSSSTPVVFGFAPTSGPVGSNVTISGANFSAATAVSFNNVSVPFTILTAGSILAGPLPANVTSGTVRVTAGASSGISSTSFVVTTPPAISGFSPTAVTPGSPVVITGTNFSGVSGVSFNGSAAAFVVNSNTQITATVPSGLLTPGPITVTTLDGAATSAGSFTIAPSGLAITGFSPTAIATGVNVTISGSGFNGASAVRFNGVSGNFTVTSNTQIVATAPTSGLVAGPISITAPLGNVTSSSNYTLTLAPIVTSFAPATATNKQEITVQGGNFLGTNIANVTVTVNGLSPSSSTRTANQFTFPIPAAATTGPIVITTSQGTVNAGNIVIAAGPPPANDNFANAQVITGASGSIAGNTANATKEPGEPNHQSNAGGASVWFKWTAPSTGGWFLFNPFNSASQHYGMIMGIYTGSAVNALTQVASGQPGSSVFTRYISAAALNAAPNQTYYIALDGFGGVMADYTLTWSPLSAPTIAGFSPSSGIAGATGNVVITGTGFTPGAAVTIGGAAVTSNVTYTSSTVMTVPQIPAAAITGPITVTTPVATGTSTGNFTITSPYILGFSPNGAAVGATVTINGANFSGATAVRFNGVSASFVVNSPAQITAVVPAGATTGAISVVTPTATAVSTGIFTVVLPPVITQQPSPQVVQVGDTVTFTVAATSNGPLEYNWLKNGVGLLLTNPTASQPTLVIPAATLADGGVYQCQVANTAAILLSDPATLTVNKVPASVVLGGLVAVYDGTPKAASATTVPPGLTVDFTYDGSPIAPSNVGTYAVTATINDAKYQGTAAGTFNIGPANGSVALSGLAAAYDGTPKSVIATTTPIGLPVQITYDGLAAPPTNAGSYVVIATIADPNFVGSITGILTVAKANAAVNFANLTQTYDGTPKSVGTTTTPTGLAVNVTYNSAATAPTNAGTYAVVATVDDPNYAGSGTATLTIQKAAAVIQFANLTQTYDGTPKSVGTTTTPTGLAVNVTYNSAASAPTDAGSYTVVATVDDPNYAGSGTATLTIQKAAAVIQFANLTQTYDGTPKSVGTTTTPTGLAVNVTYNSAASAPTNAGSYAVVATIDDPNYAGSGTATLTIQRAAAVVQFANLTQTYDGTPKSVGTTTTPTGLAVDVTYDGAATPPSNAGTYAVAAAINDANYAGSAIATLTIEKAVAVVKLANLLQSYDGAAKTVTSTTEPAGLTVNITYDGSATAPIYPGAYAVIATVSDANYRGSSSSELVITSTALVRHAPTLAGGIDGSLQVTSAENLSVVGNGWIAGDLLVPGTPTVTLRGSPVFVGTRSGAGAESPTNYAVTLTGSAALRYLVQRIDAMELPTVPAPVVPAGTRDVVISNANTVEQDFATVRNLTLRGNLGTFAVPGGAYGRFTTEGSGSLVLGVPGSETPTVYHLQGLTLNGTSTLEIVGPVVLHVHDGLTVSGRAGAAAHPEWLVLNIYVGGLALNSHAALHAIVVAPNGAVTIGGNATFRGRVTADSLSVQSDGLLKQAP